MQKQYIWDPKGKLREDNCVYQGNKSNWNLKFSLWKTGPYKKIHLSLSLSTKISITPSLFLTLLTASETAVLCQNSPLFKTYGMPPKAMNLIGFLVAFTSSLPRTNIKGRKPLFVSSRKRVRWYAVWSTAGW